MKIVSSFIAFFFLVQMAQAQKMNNIDHLEVSINNKNLYISWNFEGTGSGYWEVQGSADGKTFQPIGLVLGAKPGTESTFMFKTETKNLKKGLHYFRVLQVQQDQTAIAYTAIAAKYNPKG